MTSIGNQEVGNQEVESLSQLKVFLVYFTLMVLHTNVQFVFVCLVRPGQSISLNKLRNIFTHSRVVYATFKSLDKTLDSHFNKDMRGEKFLNQNRTLEGLLLSSNFLGA